MLLLKSEILMSLISTLFINILPLVTSYSLGIKLIRVDLPLPVLPIKAVVVPFFAIKLIFLNTSSVALLYLKYTSLNSKESILTIFLVFSLLFHFLFSMVYILQMFFICILLFLSYVQILICLLYFLLLYFDNFIIQEDT